MSAFNLNLSFFWCSNDNYIDLKGPFKYYISVLGGGGLTQIADVADALEYVHSKNGNPKKQ